MTGKFSVITEEGNGTKKPVTISGPVNSLKWNNSIDNHCNSAQIVIPGICRLKGHNYGVDSSEKQSVPVNQVIKAGMRIHFECGYDNKNKQRFSGFVVSTNVKNSRILVECEGYSYLLRNKNFDKHYNNPKLRTILNDLVAGTKIKLSEKIQDITFSGSINFRRNSLSTIRGIDVVEYLRDECGLTVWFNGNEMYVGLKFIQEGNTVKCRVNWNVVKTDTLLYKESEPYQIQIQTRKKDGSKIIVTEGTGTTLNVKVKHIKDEEYLKKMLLDKQKDMSPGNYSGSLLLFLEPAVKPTDIISLVDSTYPERSGSYFVESVEGSFSTSGGRQTVKIGIKLPTVNKK